MREPTLRVRFIEVSVKRESSVYPSVTSLETL